MSLDVLSRAAGALESLDSEALVSCYSDSFVFEDIPLGECITDRGLSRAYYDRLFALSDVEFTDIRLFASGERGAGEWTWRGKSFESGKDYSIRGASIFELGEDGIRRETLFYDPRTAYA